MTYQAHISTAHRYWEDIVRVGDTVIDATCGNGHDTLTLCKLALDNCRGHVLAIDIQTAAIQNTKNLLKKNLEAPLLEKVSFIEGSHEMFPTGITAKLVAYNLGYLPGSDKSLTTRMESTLNSLTAAQDLLIPGGIISITCYPGHQEGEREENALLQYCENLCHRHWVICHHRWVNKMKAPSLLILQKL